MSGTFHRRLLGGFTGAFGGAPDLVVRAPGRVNLIGEHTDYNDGFVLPAAIGLETRVALRRRGDDAVRCVALDFGGEQDGFALGPAIAHSAEGGWRDYVRGTIATLIGAGFALGGADIAIAGNIPRGAGLSSSASLEVAVARAMLDGAGEALDPVRLALLAQAAERDFVGCRCGVMDQLASAAGIAGSALLIDCRSLALRVVAIPADAAILIVHSGVVRGLVEGRYNDRRRECEEAAAAIGVAALRDTDLQELDAARGRMSPEAYARARHVVTENARTLEAADLLAADDLRGLGRLMAQSHASMRDDFAITVEPIDRLVALLDRAIAGEGGARMTGGGFGGAAVAVLRAAAVGRVRELVLAQYRTPDGAAPLVMVERASAGAGRVAADREAAHG